MKENKKQIDYRILFLVSIIVILLILVFLLIYIIKKPAKSVLLNKKNEYTKNQVSYPMENKDTENNNIVSKNRTNDIPTNNTSKDTSSNNNQQVSNDSKAITYFENVEKDVDKYVTSNNIDKLKTDAKDKFTTLVDFIFYGTSINGVTFNQLTETTKQKLINIVNSIDSKIENKVPGYKETIKAKASQTYTYLSGKLKQGITKIDEKIESKVDKQIYDNFKDNVNDAVDNIKDSASTIVEGGKEISSKAKDKISTWYEGWK